MKISPTKIYAVLTGDIVGSSKLAKARRQALPERLKQAGRETQKAFAAAVPLPIDVFRGDSWQLLVTDPVHSLRIALYFRALVRADAERGRGLDTRISLGLGGVDFIPRKNVSEGDGEAYRLSGRALEGLPGGLALVLAAPSLLAQETWPALIGLIDALAKGWTGPQARAVAGALRGKTQAAIAAIFPVRISQQAVTRHLAKAHWLALEGALNSLESQLRVTT
jgi:hypothetical protein